MDCSANSGCNGGWPATALSYVQSNGLTNSSDYPYVAKQGSCKKTGGSFKISGVGNVGALCSALTTSIVTQPIAVAVDATNWSPYRSGVFNNCSNAINHAVFLVGVLSGNWKIKNSWGASWGESGFIRLQSGNTCGLCLYSSSFAK